MRRAAVCRRSAQPGRTSEHPLARNVSRSSRAAVAPPRQRRLRARAELPSCGERLALADRLERKRNKAAARVTRPAASRHTSKYGANARYAEPPPLRASAVSSGPIAGASCTIDRGKPRSSSSDCSWRSRWIPARSYDAPQATPAAPFAPASARIASAASARATTRRVPRSRSSASSAATAAQKNAARRGEASKRARKAASMAIIGSTVPREAAAANPA